MQCWIIAASLAGLLLGPAAGHAATAGLTFDDIEIAPGQPIGNTNDIPQGYGDVPGLLDVRYGAIQALGSAVRRIDDALHYWGSGYSDLQGVAYCCGIGLDGAAEIALLPLGRQGAVTLHSIQFGDYFDRNDGSRMQIFAADDLSAPLFDSGPFDPGTGALTFAGLDITSESGLLIQWATAYNVGADNIQLTVTPLPAGALLLLPALGGLAWLRGRR
jgi:hypothetical protein